MSAGIKNIETFHNTLDAAGRACGRMSNLLQPHLDAGSDRRQAAEAILRDCPDAVLAFLEATPDIATVVNSARSVLRV